MFLTFSAFPPSMEVMHKNSVFEVISYKAQLPASWFVTPAQAGVHCPRWIPACAGMTKNRGSSLLSFVINRFI